MNQRDTNKRICTECRWRGQETEVRIVLDPDDGTNSFAVCPACGIADHIVTICDEPGCDKRADVGGCDPRHDGAYRWTCYPHSAMAATNT